MLGELTISYFVGNCDLLNSPLFCSVQSGPEKVRCVIIANKVAITILQGSVLTQTVLDGQSMHPPVAIFLQ